MGLEQAAAVAGALAHAATSVAGNCFNSSRLNWISPLAPSPPTESLQVSAIDLRNIRQMVANEEDVVGGDRARRSSTGVS